MNSTINRIFLVLVLIVQNPSFADMKNKDGGKIESSFSVDCEKMAIGYNKVSQELHGFKRDYYIIISLIVIFSALGIIMCYLMKRRNGTDPGWRLGNFSI